MVESVLLLPPGLSDQPACSRARDEADFMAPEATTMIKYTNLPNPSSYLLRISMSCDLKTSRVARLRKRK